MNLFFTVTSTLFMLDRGESFYIIHTLVSKVSLSIVYIPYVRMTIQDP